MIGFNPVLFYDGDLLDQEDDAIISHYGMTKLKPGDRVDCRVKASTIVSPYKSYDEIKTFEIIATDDHGFYLYVPHYYGIKGTFRADNYQCKALGIDKRFLDEEAIYIQGNMIAAMCQALDGMPCKICKEFYQYAEANQPDETLICYACRQNPYR